MKMAVVIVSYRSTHLTVDCLRSAVPEARAASAEFGPCRIIVCENGTGPEAVRTLEDAVREHAWEDLVEIRPIFPNRGFSGGNNAVLRPLFEQAPPGERPDFALLLNNDTIVREGAFRALLRAAADHPRAGVLSPRLEWPDGRPQVSCFRDFSPPYELIAAAETGPLTRALARWNLPIPVRDEPFEPGWTSFACALIRREVIERIGVLDDGYFLYFDDPDFCRRARRAGWTILHVPHARVVHLRGQSNPAKELHRARKRRPWYHYASRTRYYAKFYGGVPGVLAANALWTLGHAVALLRAALTRRPAPACEREPLDIWTNALSPMRPPNRGQDDAPPPPFKPAIAREGAPA